MTTQLTGSSDTILVTGGGGAIGSAIVEALAKTFPDRQIRTDRMGSRTNLCDPCEVDRLFHDFRPTVVIHAGANRYQPGAAQGFSRSSEDLQMTLNVLDASIDAGVKHFVFLSSSTVYETVSPMPYSHGHLVETMTKIAPMPSSPIGFSKRVGELAVEAWAKETGASHTIWRLFNVISPLERHDRPAHVHVDLYRKIVVEQQPTIELPHGVFRSFVWVDEIAHAIARYVDHDQARGQTINLGSTDFIRLRDLANTMVGIAKELGLVPMSYIPIVSTTASADDIRVPNIDKARRLGWDWNMGSTRCMELFMRRKHGL